MSKTTIHSLIDWILLLGLLAAIQACQSLRNANQPAAPTGSQLVSATPGSPAVIPYTLPAGNGPGGLTGQVFSASDVSGQANKPLPDQMVLAFPGEKASQVLGTGTRSLTDQELRFWSADLPQPNPAISATLSDAAGKYTLILDPGNYILCVADSEKSPPDFPATIRGCGRVEVQVGVIRRVDISRGLGEILLIGE